VAPGSVLYVISETGAQEVSATLRPADVQGLSSAHAIDLDTGTRRHGLRLLRLGATLAVPARTQVARLAFLEPAQAPPSGTSGTLRWQERQPHVPPSLMVRRGGELGIFVQAAGGAHGQARFVPLPGAQEGRAALMPASAGLADDALVVVQGQAALQPGQPLAAPTPEKRSESLASGGQS
jgi:hypothetical protein